MIIIEKEGGFSNAKALYDKSTLKPSSYHPLPVKSGSAGERYSNILNKIFTKDYDFKDYDRATNIYWPGNKIGSWKRRCISFWKSLKNILSEVKFKVEHVGYLDEANKNPRASVRWSLEGIHSD